MTEKINLSALSKVFADDDAARAMLERLRWPDGEECPHCESMNVYRLIAKTESKTAGRKGLWKCATCRKQFTVTVGTIFEGSRIPLGKWLMAIHKICSSKKGISALQLSRELDLTYKSAWFMAHRIRYAMSQEPLFSKLKGTVEVDETYIGGKTANMHPAKKVQYMEGRKGGSHGKAAVMSLVEREGRVKTIHMEHVTTANLKKAMRECIAPTAFIMTDEHPSYNGTDKNFAGHQVVCHAKGEYVRGVVTTNTVESVHALLKRGVMGTYHHWSKKHLHRYLAEFDFRWNARYISDGERTVELINCVGGKRLTYRDSSRGSKSY